MRNLNTRRDVGRKRGLASAKAWTPCAADADTVRSRALDDARGTVVRTGCTYTAAGVTEWQVRRSIAGRTNQYDLVANGIVIKTLGMRKLPLRFKP